MNTPKRYLITAALPYANGLKHIGHLAGAYLPADIYVRYLKAQQRDVVFVCGSDEHGTAIPIQATKEGTTAQAIIDKYHPIIEQNFKDLGIAFDIYHRTSDPLHHATASEFFKNLETKGDLEIKTSEQYFDEATNTFLADRYIKGTCPSCGHKEAYGDQCEKCGKTLSPEELINPVSTLSGQAPIKKETSHWYLPLNRHEDFLRDWILKEHANDWRPAVLGQCKSWIDGGLQEEKDYLVKVNAEPTFFDEHEMTTITVLGDIIMPKDEKADKLLELLVDLGFEQRTILSGIAMHFKPEEIVGKQVTIVANLAPRKMRGIESKGMILMAEDAAGKLYFVSPSEAIAAGSSIS